MSNLELAPSEDVCGGRLAVVERPVEELLYGREVVLGTRGMAVTRTLPHRDRRMVGAWCFIDHYGPEKTAMRIPPHPHTGLQTVSWLIDGEILHRDSLGSLQPVRPGQLNLMTAGRAITHSEESPAGRAATLHGVQFWVALPNQYRDVAPHFEHHPDLPVVREPGASVTVIMGSLDGVSSPAQVYSPLIGAQVAVDAGAVIDLPLRPDFEHAALVLFGQVGVAGTRLAHGPLLYLGSGRSVLRLAAGAPSRVLLVGGAPFDEEIIMWWNFVGRSHDEVVQYRDDWMSGRRFGEVEGYPGDPLPAPPLPTTPLKPRGRLPRAEPRTN